MAAAAVEKPSSKGQAWFCSTGLPSDIVIEVEDMAFHLHKFPLMSKSRRLHSLITEQEANPSYYSEQGAGKNHPEEEIEECHCQIALLDFPGGSETFEMAAKFCYGVKIDLTSSNVAPLRCAGEFLEMTEEYSEDNLISRTERFLSESVLKSLSESVKALKSCERVLPLAETLDLTERCIELIVAKASSADPALFGWPMSDGATRARDSSKEILWNGIEIGRRRKSAPRDSIADSWLENLTSMSLPLFKRLIFAMRDRDVKPEVIETCLMYYAKKHIAGVSRSNKKPPSSIASEAQQKELLEAVIDNLPSEKCSRSSTATRLLFGLLRTAIILNASDDCRAALEKKIGSHLEQATLDDLLIPSYSYLNETLYDVDCVERILAYFFEALDEDYVAGGAGADAGDSRRSQALMLVGKLIDGYLSEIASDANLKPEKFFKLAISLPEQARLFDDGLYRAVDVYLKAHPWISEAEKEEICGLMEYQKLTLEACTHAAQNERLPLRAVVQVLFFEQLQLRQAIAGTLVPAMTASPEPGRASDLREEEAEVSVAPAEEGSSSRWRSAVRENQVLRLDMDSMRTRVHQLEEECSTMRKVIQKIDKEAVPPSRRGSLTRKFGCKFKTQVCDSHESTVVDTRKGRHHRHRQP